MKKRLPPRQNLPTGGLPERTEKAGRSYWPALLGGRPAGHYAQLAGAVILQAGGAQAGQAMLLDCPLPGQEFLHGQRIALAGLLKRQQAATDCRDHLGLAADHPALGIRSEEHTSELQSLMRISYAVFCLKKKTKH